MSTSHWFSSRFHREGFALATISMALFVGAVLLTIGFAIAGYSLVDLTEWFVRVTRG